MPALSQAEASARSALLDVTAYAVFLDLAADPPRSRTTVRFGCRTPGETTFAELTAGFAGGTLNGARLEPPADGRLVLTGLAARNELIVDAEVAAGALTRHEQFLLIAAYPSDAPGLFPCFDQPDLICDFTLTVVTPRGWRVITNGAIAEHADGTHRCATVHGMRPYDFTLCAGPLASPAPGLWCRPPLAEAPALREFDAIAREGLRDYAELLGVPRPYPKYDIVFYPEFFATALSVPGMMVVNENVVNGPADFAKMIARHEVLHQWFGGLTAMRWWDDLWLDEALATYLAFPGPADWITFAYRDTGRAYEADAVPGTPPVSSPVQTVAQALDRPPAITYDKGSAVIRQLGALIGEDTIRRGLTDYLTRHAGVGSLDDLIACWSRASGRDLTGWAAEWLRSPGTSTLSLDGDAIVQADPRTHRLSIGLYDSDGTGLRRRKVIDAEVSGPRTVIPGLAAELPADAVLLNEGARTFARIRDDERTFQALSGAAMNVGDPLTEAACWTTAWQMVTGAELAAGEFVSLVIRRLAADPPLPLPGLEVLLDRAATAASRWSAVQHRSGLRRSLADSASRSVAGQPPSLNDPASRSVADPQVRRVLAGGMAACAESGQQLELAGSWLEASWPDTALRWKLAAALAAAGRASEQQIATLAAADPATGEAESLTCLAMRPEPGVKEAAWTAALAAATAGRWRIAQAHARGIWVAGQEDLLDGFRDRYFEQVLPLVRGWQNGDVQRARVSRRLADQLFPWLLADERTLEAMAGLDVGGPLGHALRRQEAELRAVVAARAAFS